MLGVGAVFLACLVGLALVMVVIYNTFVSKKNTADQAFATIDVMLKKRYDLIPNLVATVKQYMKHEASTLENIAKWRSQAMREGVSADESVALNNQITSALGGIRVAMEAYPELKANEGAMQLQANLTEIEEQISAARRAYNAAVTDYNNAVEMVPTNIVAMLFGYRRRSLFEIPETERQNVSVGNLFNG